MWTGHLLCIYGFGKFAKKTGQLTSNPYVAKLLGFQKTGHETGQIGQHKRKALIRIDF
jgi:hypothetical protein